MKFHCTQQPAIIIVMANRNVTSVAESCRAKIRLILNRREENARNELTLLVSAQMVYLNAKIDSNAVQIEAI